jgi:hypothetical protein
MNNGVKNAD